MSVTRGMRHQLRRVAAFAGCNARRAALHASSAVVATHNYADCALMFAFLRCARAQLSMKHERRALHSWQRAPLRALRGGEARYFEMSNEKGACTSWRTARPFTRAGVNRMSGNASRTAAAN